MNIIYWFSQRNFYEFPDFYEIEFFEDNLNYHGTVSKNKPGLKKFDIYIEEKIKNYISPNKDYRNIEYYNDFESLKKILI